MALPPMCSVDRILPKGLALALATAAMCADWFAHLPWLMLVVLIPWSVIVVTACIMLVRQIVQLPASADDSGGSAAISEGVRQVSVLVALLLQLHLMFVACVSAELVPPAVCFVIPVCYLVTEILRHSVFILRATAK